MTAAAGGARFAGHWDTAIVGAGSAGCTLANRLVTRSDRRVLVVEAGMDFPPPDGWPTEVTHGSPMDLAEHLSAYSSLYTPAQQLAFIVRGRIVGGSSAVNGGIFMRGIAEDYDSWGSPLWSYDTVTPLFIEQEHDLDFPSSSIHGSSGPIPVGRPAPSTWVPHQEAFYEAALGCGFAEKADLAESYGQGIGAVPLNRLDGYRMSAAMAFLDPVRSQPNLTISPETVVRKVRIEGGRAVGLLAERDGQLVDIGADEIVLCASGIMSPHLLVHSGVGPADVLDRLGIDVVSDVSSVGSNLHDHPVVCFEMSAPESLRPKPEDPWFQTLLVTTCESGVARNDMHIGPLGMCMDQAVASTSNDQIIRYDMVMQQAVSSGHLEFRSGDPSDHPTVHFAYVQDERDRARFREAVRTLQQILDQPALKGLGPRLEPGDEHLKDDRALDRWIANTVASAFHTSGTCRMGADDDPGAVVDFEGRVRGVDNLRVADLSIAPNVVRAPENSTAIMIGQRIGDFMTGAAGAR